MITAVKHEVEENFHGMEARFIEPPVNSIASDYIAEHFEDIIRQVRRMGVHQDQVYDLVQDVWKSIKEAELEGNGYDVSHSDEGDIITVAQFIFGRIKRYSMNSRYHPEVSERCRRANTTRCVEIIAASSADGTDLDNLDGFQKAYAMAASYDEIDGLDEVLSLRSNVEYCRKFNDVIGFDIVRLFKDIDIMTRTNFHPGIFDKLKEVMKGHDDFAEAFKEVLSVSNKSRPVYDEIIEGITY